MKKETLTVATGFAVGAGAWLSNKLGILYPILLVLLGVMVMDYITGLLASKNEALDHPGDKNYGWTSTKGAKGIIKKVGYICVIAVAMLFDYMVLTASGHLGFAMKGNTFFGLIVSIWYILNEILSIIENVGRMGADVPLWLARYVAVLREKIDNRDYSDEESEGKRE